MRFAMIRLCGGASAMLTPDRKIAIDLGKCNAIGDIIASNAEYIQFMWKGVRVTLYSNGSILFYHFIDEEKSRGYASDILRTIGVDDTFQIEI